MNWRANWASDSRKYVEKLPSHIRERILLAIEKLEEDPFRYLKHYEGQGYKFRIGEYRAIIDVHFDTKELFVRLLDKRSRIYD